jgi:phosphomevalonate kinase
VRRFPEGTTVPCPPLVAVYSGASAQTGPRVQAYRSWATRAPGAHAAFVRASRDLLRAFGEAPMEALSAGYDLLRAMGADAGLDYDTPALARIAEIARAHGGAAKPSGAGGGDVAVAAFHEADARDAFQRACAREGLSPIPVDVAPAASLDLTPSAGR